MKKILYVASLESHIRAFHMPILEMIERSGYEVEVLSKNKEGKDFKEKNIKFTNFNFSRSPFKFSTIKNLRELTLKLKENEYSLISAHTPTASVLIRLAKYIAKNKTRVIYTAHGFHFFNGANLKNWIIFYSIEKILSKITDDIIVMNQEDWDRAKKFELKQKTKVHRIPGIGINLNNYKKLSEKEILKKKLELGIGEEFILLIVGELSDRKNQNQILQAIKKINKPLKLLLVGEGVNKEKYVSFINKNKLTNKVELLGQRNDVCELINIADLICLTSKHEGLPRCILEAMAIGKPCLVSKVRGNIDLIKDSYNGYIVELDNIEETIEKIEFALNNKEIIKKIGLKNLEEIKKYSQDIVLEKLNKIFFRKGE